MSLSSALIVNAVVLAVVLLSDLGRRAFDSKSLMRSLIVCGVVVAVFVKDFFTSGTGLVMQIAGAALGVLIGLFAVRLMKVTKDADNTVHTTAGAGYASVWITMAAVRSLASIGLTYWFGTNVGTWLVKQGAALTDVQSIITNFFVFMAAAAVVTRSLTVRARAGALTATAALG